MPTDDHNNIPTECLGVTGAVNFIKPDKQELFLTQQLEIAIKNLNIFESVEETRQRREALIELQDFCNVWIYKKAIDYMYPESVAKSIKGKIFTFGSYRLGVNFSGADIDALLVGPKFISRDEFFDDFVAFLSENALAQEIHAVPKAFVPVLKMKFCGVEIDLLFASVDLMSIPHDFCLSENSDQILRNMDDRDVRSVNGVRVTDDILRLVYDKRVFKAALKIVRIWAKRRCIYSNAMGFCGGVSWAILVARICQLWPLGSVSSIVFNFFKFYGVKWPWPSPVVLKEVEQSSLLHLVQWDPRINPADQNHVMPILTPSYPSQNSTYNVCDSHKRFIIDQMRKALDLLRKIVASNNGTAPGVPPKTYDALFKPLSFFCYRHYLVVTYRCGGDDRKLFREQSSLVESKLRLLVQYLEGNAFVDFALLYLRSFDRLEPAVAAPPQGHDTAAGDGDAGSVSSGGSGGDTVAVRRWFIGLELRKVDKSLYLVDEINRFKNVVKLVDLDVSYCRRGNLGPLLPPDEMERIREKAQHHSANAAAAAAAAAVAVAAAANAARKRHSDGSIVPHLPTAADAAPTATSVDAADADAADAVPIGGDVDTNSSDCVTSAASVLGGVNGNGDFSAARKRHSETVTAALGVTVAPVMADSGCNVDDSNSNSCASRSPSSPPPVTPGNSACKRLKTAVPEQDVSSSTTVVAKCSSTEDTAQLSAMSAVSSTTEKEDQLPQQQQPQSQSQQSQQHQGTEVGDADETATGGLSMDTL